MIVSRVLLKHGTNAEYDRAGEPDGSLSARSGSLPAERDGAAHESEGSAVLDERCRPRYGRVVSDHVRAAAPGRRGARARAPQAQDGRPPVRLALALRALRAAAPRQEVTSLLRCLQESC